MCWKLPFAIVMGKNACLHNLDYQLTYRMRFSQRRLREIWMAFCPDKCFYKVEAYLLDIPFLINYFPSCIEQEQLPTC